MTRKDYVLIADTFAKFGKIRDLDQTINWSQEDLARNLADALQADNDRFDSARFLNACGIK
jgi:hypothetical protein